MQNLGDYLKVFEAKKREVEGQFGPPVDFQHQVVRNCFSTLIDFRENDVKHAIEQAGLQVIEINHQGEWVNITARKVTK